MSLPSNTDLNSLDIAYLGAPFVHVEAKPLDTETLDVTYLGSPFVGVGPTAAPTGSNVYIKVGGVWKQSTAIYINAGGTWKSVNSVSANVAGQWKS